MTRLDALKERQAKEIAELRVQIEAADLMLSAGKAMATRLTHVVGPEGVVKHWNAIAATYRAARGQK